MEGGMGEVIRGAHSSNLGRGGNPRNIRGILDENDGWGLFPLL